MPKVNFKAGKLAQWNNSTKDTNTLYFLTDVKKIYKGDVDVTSAVEIVTSFDGAAGAGNIALADAVAGKFYVNASTFEMRVKNGPAWAIMSPGYLVAGGNSVPATDDDRLGTVGYIKGLIASAIEEINTNVSYDNSTGTLTVGDSTARLTGVINGITYSQEHLQLTVSSVSASGAPTTQTISLPKDNFVRSGRYEAEYTLPDPPGGTGPAIVLVVNDGTSGTDKEVVIPAASLVEVYTGGSSDNITVNVSEGNQITATAIIDPVQGNALVSSATGLKVDISGKANTVTATNGNVIVADGTGNFKDGGVTILTSGAMGSSTTQIPVSSVIAAAIASAVSASQGTLQTAIDALDDRVTDLETFQTSLAGKYLTSSVANNFVGFADASGNIKDSGKKAGAATLAESPDANTLATEAAVAAAVANFTWQEIS